MTSFGTIPTYPCWTRRRGRQLRAGWDDRPWDDPPSGPIGDGMGVLRSRVDRPSAAGEGDPRGVDDLEVTVQAGDPEDLAHQGGDQAAEDQLPVGLLDPLLEAEELSEHGRA